jgi:hypothetical protein
MADVASKQQTPALFLSTVVTRTRRHTELTNLMGNLCCAREHSVQFFVQFFTQLNCTVQLKVYGALNNILYTVSMFMPLTNSRKCFTGKREKVCEFRQFNKSKTNWLQQITVFIDLRDQLNMFRTKLRPSSGA